MGKGVVFRVAVWIAFWTGTCLCQANYGNSAKPRISVEFELPLTELVDTCHAYAEQKGKCVFVVVSVACTQGLFGGWVLQGGFPQTRILQG